ncbi:MAG: phosphatidate cytidylyltransferase [Crocinitomicaceae bacterium]|jgi:phosphatidate cytidylyltransferase
MNNLITRCITGILFVGVILGAIFWSPIATTIVFSIFMLLGVIEFIQVFKNHPKVNLSLILGILTALIGLILLLFYIYGFGELVSIERLIIVLVSLPVLLFLTILFELWRKKEHPILNISISTLGFIYVVVPFLLIILLGHSFPSYKGFPLLAGMFLLIWTNDTFAYITGRLIGKTKLIERISPNKTWEGTIGGILFSVAVGITIGHFTENMEFWVGAAIIVAPTAILGDLIESMFKRSLNIKDSGTILPGHGGILDRFDATLLTIPFFLMWTAIFDFIF